MLLSRKEFAIRLRAVVAAIQVLSGAVTSRREKAQMAMISARNNSIVGDMLPGGYANYLLGRLRRISKR
jgi:hypothetical protein